MLSGAQLRNAKPSDNSTQALRAKMIQAWAHYLGEARRTHLEDEEKRAA